VLAQAQPALKKNFFVKLGQKFQVFMFTFELICMLLEGYFKIFTLSGFFLAFKKYRNFWIFSAHSACVGNFLAQAQPA
jgi:hypothetical protein